MTKRASVLTAIGVAVAVFGVSPAANARAGGSRLTYLTFSRAVALPGVMLPAGTYAFDITNPESNSDVVRVRNRERTKVYYVGMTHAIRRPNTLGDRPLEFGEARAGAPLPIRAWYPTEEMTGHAFLYPR